jgi:hypothetical protein
MLGSSASASDNRLVMVGLGVPVLWQGMDGLLHPQHGVKII